MIDRGKHDVLGVLVDAVDYDGAVERIIGAARARRPMAVSALAVHGLMTGVLDPVQRYRLNQFDLLAPDGQPVRWALNWLYRTRLPEVVAGRDLMLAVCRRAAEEQLPICLFGCTCGLLHRLRESLLHRVPGLHICDVVPSRFRRLSAVEREQLTARIRGSGAAITFVGIGCPRQEVWAYEFRTPLSMPVVAVGAAFDFLAGTLPHAPDWMQRRGLEWFYRLIHEPRRLWRRYCLLNPLYLGLLFLQAAGLRRFDPANSRAPQEDLLYG